MPATLEQHLHAAGPKRILALDGGGLRGILTLAYLKHIEHLLKKRSDAGDDFRLCDYFDLIGGTSTGSIIAAGLALGMTVDELLALYRDLGGKVFKQEGWKKWLPDQLHRALAAKFPVGPVDEALQDKIGRSVTLGDASVRTGLMIMTKRLDTASPWPLHNNARGRYYDTRQGGKGIPNKNFKLWQIVRASTAAPTYFEPELIDVVSDADGRSVKGAFVDGGVSMAGNPAWQLFMLATLSGYKLEWEPGEDKLLLISVGTGFEPGSMSLDQAVKGLGIEFGVRALSSMMGDADAMVRLLLQWVGNTLFSEPMAIDGEVGDLHADTIGGRKLLSYVRYNARFDQAFLGAQLGLNLTDAEIDSLIPMDRPENLDLLEKIGDYAASRQLADAHFPTGFDVR